MSSLSRRHQRDQATLIQLMLRDLRRIPLTASGEYTAEQVAIIRQYASASGAVAADYYSAARRDAGIRSRYSIGVARPPAPEQVVTSLSVATRGLRDGTQGETIVEAMVRGMAQRHALNTGRLTLARAVTHDSAARGWVRVPSGPDACSFCRTMCIRGATFKDTGAYLYSTRGTAGETANPRFVGDGKFKFHDNCGCNIDPIFTGREWEPSPLVRQWQDVYETSTDDFTGTKNKLNAFRRAVYAETHSA